MMIMRVQYDIVETKVSEMLSIHRIKENKNISNIVMKNSKTLE